MRERELVWQAGSDACGVDIMTVYIEESEIHDIDVLAQTITHLAARLSLHDPLREPIEVIAGIIVDKTQELQRRYEASLQDRLLKDPC
jgi:hypothetical protein